MRRFSVSDMLTVFLAICFTGAIASAWTPALSSDVHAGGLEQADGLHMAMESDRAAWAANHRGGYKRKRALLDTYGVALGTADLLDSPTSSSSKIQPSGDECFIASSATDTEDCTGYLAYIVPACCSSSSETASTSCLSWDNGQTITCGAAERPYPACCTFRNQTSSACSLHSTSVICDDPSYPGVGCCTSSTCTLRVDGSGGTCPLGNGRTIGCCPA